MWKNGGIQMVMSDRIKVLLRTPGVVMLILFGPLYGTISSIPSFIKYLNGNASLFRFFVEMFLLIVSYSSLFLWSIITLIVGFHIKSYLSLGMTHKTVLRIWKDMMAFISGFMVLSVGIVILISQRGIPASLRRRILNVDFNALSIIEVIKVLAFVIAIVLFANLMGTLFCTVANRFGGFLCTALILCAVSLTFLLIKPIAMLLIWGDNYAITLVVITVIDIVLIFVNKKWILQTEVVR